MKTMELPKGLQGKFLQTTKKSLFAKVEISFFIMSALLSSSSLKKKKTFIRYK